MKLIDVSTPKHPNAFAMVDDEDFERVKHLHWYAHQKKVGKTIYVRAELGDKYFSLHRLIMNPPLGAVVDHKDRNGLNNLRSNLRVASFSQNAANQSKITKPSLSKFKGVTRNKSSKKWRAKIGVYKKYLHLGVFSSEAEAGKAYDIAAIKYHGEFACLNFPIREAETRDTGKDGA